MFVKILLIFTCVTVCSVHGGQTFKDVLMSYTTTDVDYDEEEKKALRKYSNSIKEAITRDFFESVNLKTYNDFKKCRIPGCLQDLTVAKAFLVQDGTVTVLFTDLKLKEFPRLIPMWVQTTNHGFGLVTKTLSFLMQATYNSWRYESSLIDNADAEHSPFAVRRAGTSGNVTIALNDCEILVNNENYMLVDQHRAMRTKHMWSDCKMTTEITGFNAMTSPPVIAPYFPPNYASRVQLLLGSIPYDPFGSLYVNYMKSYYNISGHFHHDLKSYRKKHNANCNSMKIFFEKFVNVINNLALQESKGSLELPDLKISADEPKDLDVFINATLYGLEAAHYLPGFKSFTGPGFRFEMRYKYIKVKGYIKYGTNNAFYALDLQDELCVSLFIIFHKHDLTIDRIMNEESSWSYCNGLMFKNKVLYSDASLYEPFDREDRKLMDNLIKAYILEKLMTVFDEHLKMIADKAVASLKDNSTFWEQLDDDVRGFYHSYISN